MASLSNLPSTTAILSTYTSFAASAMLVRSMITELKNITNQLLPKSLQEKIHAKFGGLFGNPSLITLVIDEYHNGGLLNGVFEAASAYLRTKITDSNKRLKVTAPRGAGKAFCLTFNNGEMIIDTFEGVELQWKMVVAESQKTSSDVGGGALMCETVERKWFELTFDKRYREMVLNTYLHYVMEISNAMKKETKAVYIFSLGNSGLAIDLKHPSTFQTLAMDPIIKKEITVDLDRFERRKDYYRRVGKAWKRGYLLYGPPGTGKSSLIAAMANYLKFPVYDLELANVTSNSELRRLLISTRNQSILVIEDIDCSVRLQNREANDHEKQDGSKITLSGLLNFIDGLWSTCGDERIIVFTTNYKDKLDPALLRPGRMDKHIFMSFLTSSGFKILASNYLGISNHDMFDEIEKLVAEVAVTPAEVAEELMKTEDTDAALGGLNSIS